ncbi:hypothetical protein L195_g032155 [Trifolium pratense]|uniref:Uncharacterized protein n=1 Tax=Trifolium pratense TaxID=57577 RepID=A0A2K3LCE9_TRIPR|nr:hypothetical protein L195_g031440 [Trifolium pratense]PNX76210.1 hypothetical protein L195_g032155 [Trifolium pratense]
MASRWPPILQGSPKGMFVTVHAPNQIYGEVDPFFLVNFFNEISNQWKFFDDEGRPSRSLLPSYHSMSRATSYDHEYCQTVPDENNIISEFVSPFPAFWTLSHLPD